MANDKRQMTIDDDNDDDADGGDDGDDEEDDDDSYDLSIFVVIVKMFICFETASSNT